MIAINLLGSKQCTRCERVQSQGAFPLQKNTRSRLGSWCKRCKREACAEQNRLNTRAYEYEERTAKRRFVRDYKSFVGCACGEHHPAALDLHHRDPESKISTIAQLAGTAPFDLLVVEIAKCDVICSNCHRKHHYDEGQALRDSRPTDGCRRCGGDHPTKLCVHRKPRRKYKINKETGLMAIPAHRLN